MARKAQQQEMFPDGQDLPLFSGACVRAQVSDFTPQPAARQLSFFGRPTMTPQGRTVTLTGPHDAGQYGPYYGFEIREADGSLVEGYNAGDYYTARRLAQEWADHLGTPLDDRASR